MGLSFQKLLEAIVFNFLFIGNSMYYSSLTCLCCKVMRHITLSHIAKHLSVSNILLDCLLGFREKQTTVIQLVLSCHDFAITVQSQGQIDVVFFLL